MPVLTTWISLSPADPAGFRVDTIAAVDASAAPAACGALRVKVRPMHTSTVGLSGLAGAFAKLATAPEEVKILVDPRLA